MKEVDAFFEPYPESCPLFEVVFERMQALGPTQIRISKTQISFRRRKDFVWVWIPEKHLHRNAAPLVLSVAFPQPDPSPRWKQIVEPAPGRFMHHLELYRVEDINEEVDGWLRDAWNLAA
jgi:hypothetical protein